MALCDAIPWTMTLILREVDEVFTFNLNADGTGTVNLTDINNTRMSDLIWACRSLGAGGSQRALLTFHFRFRRRRPTGNVVESGAMFVGIARVIGGVTQVRGNVSTFLPNNDVPAGGPGEASRLQVDPGDTGTGNGNQGA
jgi:hypothetical protein